ncbi:MAG TPA: hypothetical protein VJ179_01540 [Patescibacteria group bacterium]|nr:hypothetical protein [Patescibacteria group bacterium]
MKHTLKKGIAIATSLASGLLLPVTVFAQGQSGTITPGGNFARVSTFTIPNFIGTLVTLIFLIAGVVAFLYLIWGGVQWITSGGDKAGVAQAREKITAAVIGLAIVLLSWAIMALVGQFFGLNFFNFQVPNL